MLPVICLDGWGNLGLDDDLFITDSDSLFWLLKEPLVHGATLNVSSAATLGSKAPAGPASMNSQAAGCLLGICSTRVARKVLQLWRERLSVRERYLLMDYSQQCLIASIHVKCYWSCQSYQPGCHLVFEMSAPQIQAGLFIIHIKFWFFLNRLCVRECVACERAEDGSHFTI